MSFIHVTGYINIYKVSIYYRASLAFISTNLNNHYCAPENDIRDLQLNMSLSIIYNLIKWENEYIMSLAHNSKTQKIIKNLFRPVLEQANFLTVKIDFRTIYCTV
ncbi:hypothetical protein RF11_05618 [Thelohanellus kitauei]|uniref:Uncharacterized protein n=1 Tax=Thelohanellus kitauei TaxID=669202 RepID=A0A0C2M863_THEKT|nr:hypothetical protein RF11_05618 [Thelohanellus kitauei]